MSTMLCVTVHDHTTDEDRGFLATYDPHAFPPVAVTVDLVILTVREGELCVLLIRRGEPPFAPPRTPAGGVGGAGGKREYPGLATTFLDEPFTIADLRRVYETVWGVPLHAANFRRKVLSTPGFVEPTGEKLATGRGWAELYRRGTT